MTEFIEVDPIGLPGTDGRDGRDDRHTEGDGSDRKRDVGRARRSYGSEDCRKHGSDRSPDILADGHRRDPALRWKEFGVQAREDGVVALIDDAPHEERGADRHPHVVDADGVEIGERQQPRAERADDDQWPATNLVRQVADKRDDEDRQDIARDGYPQIDRLSESLSRRPAGRHRRRRRWWQPRRSHSSEPCRRPAACPSNLAGGFGDRRLRDLAVFAFFGEGRSFLDLSADDVSRKDHEGTQEERDPPAIGVEGFRGHEMRDR
jgi:hypothetical protein